MFRPIVGPSAVSDTGDPASPSAPAVAISANMAPVDIPNCVHIGTYIAEIIGTVENDDPMPVVSSHPNPNNTKIVANLLLQVIDRSVLTNGDLSHL